MSNLSAISWWEQVAFQWDGNNDVRSILDKQAYVDFNIAHLLKQ